MKVLRRIQRHFVVYIMMPIFNNYGRRFYLSHRPDFSSHINPEEMKHFIKIWEHGQRGNNRGDWARLYFLISSIKDLHKRNVPGALAELGVYKGASAKILNSFMPDRDLYLFDTFEGFNIRDTEKDPSGVDAGHFEGSLQEVKEFIGLAANVHYCKGVFPDTVSEVPEDVMFALMHLDCDLYEPMKAACEFFYDRLEPGGLLIIHDYHSGCWPGVKQAVDRYFADKLEQPVLIPDKSGTAVVVKNNLNNQNSSIKAIRKILSLSVVGVSEEAFPSLAMLAFI
ncbi:MAG: TylF/MycF/NovP-related O-methyltransferase [Micavibrio sp.]